MLARPRVLTFAWWGCYGLYLTSSPLLFILFWRLFPSLWPFNCISFHKKSPDNSPFSYTLFFRWKGKEDKADKERGGKTASGNGQAWSSASPRGQWRTGKNGENWLQNHLWCPMTLAVKGLMMMMMMMMFFRCYLCLIGPFSYVPLFTEVFFNPDIIPSGWLGSKHQLTDYLTVV